MYEKQQLSLLLEFANCAARVLANCSQPLVPAMLESLQAFADNIRTTIADLIDNSISAGAKNIQIRAF